MIARTLHRPVLLAMFAATLAGCAKKSHHDASMAPAAGAEDDLTALEQQLAQREGELQAIGVTPVARSRKVNLDESRDAATQSAGGATAGAAGDAGPPVPSPGPAPSVAPPPADADRTPEDPGRCERVCEISAAICTLKEQICGLLPRHPGEARYQDACDRSLADCDLATEACHACTAN